MYVEMLGDPTAALINYALQIIGNDKEFNIAAIETACYLGGIGSCTSLTQASDAQLQAIRPVLN